MTLFMLVESPLYVLLQVDLTEVNMAGVKTPQEFYKTLKSSPLFGLIGQPSFTIRAFFLNSTNKNNYVNKWNLPSPTQIATRDLSINCMSIEEAFAIMRMHTTGTYNPSSPYYLNR